MDINSDLFSFLFGIESLNKWMEGKTIFVKSVKMVETLPAPAVSVMPSWKNLENPIGDKCNFTMVNVWDCLGENLTFICKRDNFITSIYQ